MANGEFGSDDLPDPQEVLDYIKARRGYLWAGAALVVALIAVFGSFFQVEPDERAIVLRFGRPTGVEYGPGLHMKLPIVDEAFKVAVERQHRLEFGFRSDPGKETVVKEQGYEHESLMLTGDLQLIHVRWSLIYKIDDMKTWLFNVDNQEETIRDISMAIMRQLVGDYSLHELLTVKVPALQNEAARETQSALRDKVPTGVEVTELSIRSTDVPLGAKEAFNEFNRTEPAVRRQLADSQAALEKVTGEADQEKKTAVGQAQKRALEIQLNAEGEAKAFLAKLAEYRQAPEITRQWMYLQTMQRVLSGADEKIVLGANAGGSTLKLLPLNDLGGKGGGQ